MAESQGFDGFVLHFVGADYFPEEVGDVDDAIKMAREILAFDDALEAVVIKGSGSNDGFSRRIGREGNDVAMAKVEPASAAKVEPASAAKTTIPASDANGRVERPQGRESAVMARSTVVRAEVEDDEDGKPRGEGQIVVEYEELPETGTVRVRIHGDFTALIHESTNAETGKVEYTSPTFNKPQADLKQAIEWVGRNTLVRATRDAWNAKNPKDSSGRRSSAKASALEAALAAMQRQMEDQAREAKEREARIAEREANIMRMMERLGAVALPE